MATRMASSSAFLLPRNLMVPTVRPSYSMVPGVHCCANVGEANDTSNTARAETRLRMASGLVDDEPVHHAHAARQALGEVGIVRDHHQRHAVLLVELDDEV